MAKSGFTKHSYEVFVLKAGRWSIETVCSSKADAVAAAEDLLNKPDAEGARAVAIDDATGKEEILFEELTGGGGALKPVAVERVPVCAKADDVYGVPARLAIGRVVRPYLDVQGVTALELLFDAGRLTMLERMDTFFPSAMSLASGAQARHFGGKPVARSEALYDTFAAVRDRAKDGKKSFDQAAAAMESGGLFALVAQPGGVIAHLGGLASYLSHAGDWRDKASRLLDLAAADNAPHDGVALLDGAMAEILDGAEAVKDILAGQKDTGTALLNLTLLAQGRYRPNRGDTDVLAALAARLRDDGWPQSRHVLFERVGRGLGGTKPLTREGGDADQEIFMRQVKELGCNDGLGGGPVTAGAVVLRAKMMFATDDGDAPMDRALEQILYMLPARGARMGLILDLCCTDLWQRHNALFMQMLSHVIGQVTSPRGLVAQGATQAELDRTIEGLMAKLDSDALPGDLKNSLGAAFSGLLKKDPGAPAPSSDKETRTMPTDMERRKQDAGSVIFQEGDSGDSAFIIADGEVEIVRGDRVIATVGKGEIIGELALIDNHPRMATARAVGPVELIAISQANLTKRIERLEHSDKVMRLIMETLVRRLRGE